MADGSRLAKSAPRVAAIGDVDEANSAIGVALLHVRDEEHRAMLARIQNEMFDLGADIATPGEDFAPSDMVLRVTAPQIARLESEIDAMNESLEPLRSFILPGGDGGAAHLHLASAEQSVLRSRRQPRWRSIRWRSPI